MPHSHVVTHAFLTSLNLSSCFTVFESLKKKFPSHPHGVWTSNLPLLLVLLLLLFIFLFFNPHGVSVSPFVLYSLLLGFIRYWFFSFAFDFDYLILFLFFDHLVHMMILISIFSMTNESCVIKWTFKLSSCLFQTLKLISYLDVMNLFAICHLDVNVMTDW